MAEHQSFSNPFLPPGEPVAGQTYRADGWAYMNVSRVVPEGWDRMVERAGAENLVVLAMSKGTNRAGQAYVRGQVLVSPQGLEALRAAARPMQ